MHEQAHNSQKAKGVPAGTTNAFAFCVTCGVLSGAELLSFRDCHRRKRNGLTKYYSFPIYTCLYMLFIYFVILRSALHSRHRNSLTGVYSAGPAKVVAFVSN